MQPGEQESRTERMNEHARWLMQDPDIETHAQFFERFRAAFPEIRGLNNFVPIVCLQHGFAMRMYLEFLEPGMQWKKGAPEEQAERIQQIIESATGKLGDTLRLVARREQFLRAEVDRMAQKEKEKGVVPEEFRSGALEIRSGNEELLHLYRMHQKEEFGEQPEEVRQRVHCLCDFFYRCARAITLNPESPRRFYDDILQ